MSSRTEDLRNSTVSTNNTFSRSMYVTMANLSSRNNFQTFLPMLQDLTFLKMLHFTLEVLVYIWYEPKGLEKKITDEVTRYCKKAPVLCIENINKEDNDITAKLGISDKVYMLCGKTIKMISVTALRSAL